MAWTDIAVCVAAFLFLLSGLYAGYLGLKDE